jgi:hypothetical protein
VGRYDDDDREDSIASLLGIAAGAGVGWYAGKLMAKVLSWMAWMGIIAAILFWMLGGGADVALLVVMFWFGLIAVILILILRVLEKKIMGDD